MDVNVSLFNRTLQSIIEDSGLISCGNSIMQPLPSVSQVENNIQNLKELMTNIRTLLQANASEDGKLPPELKQLQTTLQTAENKFREGFQKFNNLKKHMMKLGQRNSEKEGALSRQDIVHLSSMIQSEGDRIGKGERSFSGVIENNFEARKRFLALALEELVEFSEANKAELQLSWSENLLVLVVNVGDLMKAGIFFKQTTSRYFPYGVRVFAHSETLSYWTCSDFYIFHLLTERAQAALDHYCTQGIDDLQQKRIDNVLQAVIEPMIQWLKSHEDIITQNWQLQFDTARSVFLPACIQNFEKFRNQPPRHPNTCISSKHRKASSFVGASK